MTRASLLALAIALAGCGPDLTGQKERGMQNCPSAVDGARTSLTYTDDGVDLEITADRRAAQRRIRVLARLHVAMQEPDPERSEHGGRHGGPGTIGHCPVIHDGTVVTLADIAGGARIHVTASSPRDVAALQLRTSQRVAALGEDQR